MAHPKPPLVTATSNRLDQSRSRVVWLSALIWMIASIAIAVLAQPALGQQASYSALDVDEKYQVEMAPYDATEEEQSDYKKRNRDKERNQRDSFVKVDAILEGGGNLADPIIKDYFEGYVFPSMTTIDNRVLSKLGETRAQYVKDFLNPKVNGNARSGIIALTIQGMQNTCKNSKLHPAARLNAVYLIGMLDEVPYSRDQMPVPSKAAYNSLKTILDSNDDDAFPSYLKVAALAGIQRHMELDQASGGSQIAAADKAALTTKIVEYLKAPDNDDLSYWLKRRSMQLLGLLGDPRSLDQALTILKSKDAGFWLRYDALDTIGQLRLTADPEKNKQVSIAIAEFLANALEEESKHIKNSVDKLVYDQILFADVDLKVTGTNYGSGETAQKSGNGFGSGGGRGTGGIDGGLDGGLGGMGPGGDGGLGMGGEPGGGLGGLGGGRGGGGMGLGGPGGGLGGGRGGMGLGGTTDEKPKLELPVYQLNLARRKIKALAFTGANVLGGETGQDGLKKVVDDSGKTFITNVVKELNVAIKESDFGIVDLDARDRDVTETSEDTPTVTDKLIEVCANSAKKLSALVRAETGEPEPAAADDNPLAGVAPDADASDSDKSDTPKKDDPGF